ncbi:putative leucine-rich repeat-containing protein let-4 [Penaeus vannamei]|uniref:Putative leucine-rich repeat-containing protein let-4 n=1 Tax=Penaeus vannamei TaxID=6689 RepID=A0A423TSV3_PENVA|nr:putative leucine-rich repeat-containing protein let-4 [Penaeus vannamei]
MVRADWLPGIRLGRRAGKRATVTGAREIAPCTCKEKSRGPSLVCENVDEKAIQKSLSVLKKGSSAIYRLMFRNSDFPRIQDYFFLGLNVQHLTMSRSNISVVEESSLRTLAGTLETLDLSYNNLHTVPLTPAPESTPPIVHAQ